MMRISSCKIARVLNCWAQSGKECKASIAGVLELLVTHSFSIHVGLRYNMLVFCLFGPFKCVVGRGRIFVL
jgi:hypothetical protein